MYGFKLRWDTLNMHGIKLKWNNLNMHGSNWNDIK